MYKVSAIVSTYKSERFIRGCLEALVGQTLYQRNQLEIIVIDSNSPENEQAIVKSFQNQYLHINYQRTSDRETLYATWNRAIHLASGEHIINANTDDRFAPAALELMAAKLDANPGIDAVYGDWVVTRVENDYFDSETDKYIFRYPEFFPPLLFYHQITSHAALMRRSVFAKVGFYDQQFKVFGDREFMFRFAEVGLNAQHIDQPVGLYLDHDTNLGKSSNAALTEFVPLRKKYLAPNHVMKLFRHPYTENPVEISQLYATIGSLAKAVLYWNYQPIDDFYFAIDPLQKSLALDDKNLFALNNLGVFLCLHQNYNQAINLFQKALCNSDLALHYKILLGANIDTAKQHYQHLENYYWLRPDSLDSLVGKQNLEFTGFSDQTPLPERPSDTLLPLEIGNLQEYLNLALFPDWSQPEDRLVNDLMFAIDYVYTLQQSSSHNIMLWIESSGISDEDINQVLAAALLNLAMNQDLEIQDEAMLSLTNHLSIAEQQTVYRNVKGRISIKSENLRLLQDLNIEIPVWEVDK